MATKKPANETAAPAAPETKTTNEPAVMPSIKAAPRMKSGDAIELTPLLGKLIAVRVTNRYQVETKFGARTLNEVSMVVDGETEPLQGVLFQSYFKNLELNQWFVGVVTRSDDRRMWGLETEHIDRAAYNRIVGTIQSLPSADLPF